MTSPAPEHTSGRQLGIGDVLALLQRDFPDVTISKIRFLEAEGLVEPQRTAAGYRKFASADVDRLRYVLRAQRDHYLPLRVIREHLDALDRGLEPPTLPAAHPTVPDTPAQAGPTVDGSTPEPELRLSRRELLLTAGIDDDLLEGLEEHGLIRRSDTGSPGAAEYSRDAFRIAGIARQMSTFGIEPRHLRSMRTAVDREAGLIEQVVRPLSRQRDPEAATLAVRQLASLCSELHAAMLRAALPAPPDGP